MAVNNRRTSSCAHKCKVKYALQSYKLIIKGMVQQVLNNVKGR